MIEEAANEYEEDKWRGNEMLLGHNMVDALDDKDGHSFDAAPIQSSGGLSETFHALKKVCFDCKLPEASIYLKKRKAGDWGAAQ